jgi:prephenate dehydrogenase
MSQISIIGLGLIGTSIGLGLKNLEQNHTLIGHDKDRKAMDQALKVGAVDTTHWNLVAACRDADMIVLALPINDIAPTLEAIKLDLKPGCLIMDTAPLKRPVQEAVTQQLPDNVHFIGGNPILQHGQSLGPEDATADLFQGATWTLCPQEDVNPDAVKVAANMVSALGANPYFLSASEHDGLVAAAESLPLMLSGALMHAVSHSQAWPEIRRVAGMQFEQSTLMPEFDPAALTETVFENRDNISYWLEAMLAELTGWKKALDNEDAETIQAWFETGQKRRRQWLAMQERGHWEDVADEAKIERTGFMARMFGAGSLSRHRGKLWKS